MNQRNLAAAQIAATLLNEGGNLTAAEEPGRRKDALRLAFTLLDEADRVAEESVEFPAALIDKGDDLPFE